MLLIFDCDGVLIDSEIVSARVDCEMLRDYGYDVSPEEIAHRFAGFSTEQIFRCAGEELGRAIPEEVVREAERETDRRLSEEVQPVEGVHHMLDALDDPRCICSNSRPERLQVSLAKAGLWDRFRPYVFSARELANGNPKPAPDIFLHAAKVFEADATETIVLEDSPVGVTGAAAARMRVVGFTGASHTWPGHADALIEAGAITVIRRLQEFPATVEALREWRPQTI
jgi:HAD superfamily hydrolase (TIGR01509 family)